MWLIMHFLKHQILEKREDKDRRRLSFTFSTSQQMKVTGWFLINIFWVLPPTFHYGGQVASAYVSTHRNYGGQARLLPCQPSFFGSRLANIREGGLAVGSECPDINNVGKVTSLILDRYILGA